MSTALNQLFAGLFGSGAAASNVTAALGAIKPFAAGGVIGTPTYFPLAQGGIGLAGEAGPEAILPLARGPDGRLGVASGGGRAGANITIHIATPDAESFRRSESYITGQIARAVARGQRSLARCVGLNRSVFNRRVLPCRPPFTKSCSRSTSR